MKTSVAKWGNSQAVRIPKEILNKAKISDGDIVNLTVKKDSIVITKASRKTIQERFKDFDGSYEPIEINWGEPVGKEVW